MLRWLAKTDEGSVLERRNTVLFTMNAAEHAKETKEFIFAKGGKCTCIAPNAKFDACKRIVKKQGRGTAARLGSWVYRVVSNKPGRENALLLFGRKVGTGKSTVLSAMLQAFPNEMSHAPDGDNEQLAFHGYRSIFVLTFYFSA